MVVTKKSLKNTAFPSPEAS